MSLNYFSCGILSTLDLKRKKTLKVIIYVTLNHAFYLENTVKSRLCMLTFFCMSHVRTLFTRAGLVSIVLRLDLKGVLLNGSTSK